MAIAQLICYIERVIRGCAITRDKCTMKFFFLKLRPFKNKRRTPEKSVSIQLCALCVSRFVSPFVHLAS